MTDFQGKRVLVTGGCSGIGQAIADAFVDAGAEVIATGLTDAEVDRAGRRERFQPRILDVSEDDQIDEIVRSIDRLDALVNCAGAINRGAEFEIESFAQVVDVNLTGTMRMCLACRELLFASRGSVVNAASMLSFFGSGFAPAYSASKGGVAQLTKSLAIAWASRGVRVNAVAPGWIETPLTQPLYENVEKSRQILDRTPMRRWGRPEDVAGAALFLCSPAAGFITGVVLPVDGGYSAS